MKYCTELTPSRFKRNSAIRHAIDDIYGGDYGEPSAAKCEMPVAAIVGAVFGGAALAAGGLTVFGTIAAIGAVVAGVGTLVGDKDLAKIGGVMSLAGGIGGFASGQGWTTAADAAKAGGDAASTTSSMIDQATAGAPVVDAGSSIAEAAATGATDVVGNGMASAEAVNGGVLQNSIGDTTAALTGSNVGPVGGQAVGEALPSLTTNDGGFVDAFRQSATPGVGQVSSDLGKGLITTPSITDSIGPNMMEKLGAASGPQSFPGAMSAANPESLSVWDRLANATKGVSAWADQNKMATYAGLQLVGGIGETLTDKYKNTNKALESQAELYAARAAEEKRQSENANYVPNLSGSFARNPGATPFKANQPTYIAPKVGLINK